jgi:hypothetical protein
MVTRAAFIFFTYHFSYYNVTRIRNMYSQNPNNATTFSNTKLIFQKQSFIILCGQSLPMRPKARVLALISVMPKLLCAEYQQLELPDARS